MQLSWDVIHQPSSEPNTTQLWVCGYTVQILDNGLLFYPMMYHFCWGKNVKTTHWAVCQLTSPKMVH